jgi:hypothetical protein
MELKPHFIVHSLNTLNFREENFMLTVRFLSQLKNLKIWTMQKNYGRLVNKS